MNLNNPSKKKILLLIYSGVGGGILSVVHEEIKQIKEMGYHSIILGIGEHTLSEKITDFADEVHQINEESLCFPLILDEPFYFYKSFLQLKRLKKKVINFIENENIDVIHSNRPGFALLLNTSLNKKHICCVHQIPKTDSFFRVVKLRVKAYCLNRVALASSVARAGIAEYEKRLKKKPIIIYNAVKKAELSHSSVERNKSVVIGAIGRIRKEKAYHVLIDAISILSKSGADVKLLVAGQPNNESELRYFEQLKTQIEELGLKDKVHLAGYMKSNDYLSQIDIACNPAYPHKDVCSMVILEAFSAHKPVIASDLGGNPELIKHDYNGFLVKPNDSKDLAEKLLILVNDKSLRDKISEVAFEEFLNRFSPEVWNKNLKSMFLTIDNISK